MHPLLQRRSLIGVVAVVAFVVTCGLPPRSFGYDDNGSLLDDGAGRTFAYDALGRLTSVNGTVDASYAYDGAGRRVSATVDAVTTDFILDIRGLGSPLSDGTRRFLPGSPNAGHETGGAWLNALTNQQGSVLGHADASGLVGSLSHYDPYGAPLPGESGLGTGPAFTGEWTDATGLVDLRFRTYDPTVQAFVARDTFAGVASAPLSANRYAYALGNPLRFTDPSGHFAAEFERNRVGFSFALQMSPILGDLYSGAIGLTGFDPIAGYELSMPERFAAVGTALLFAPGGGFHLLGHAGMRAGDDIAEAAGRSVGDVGGGLRRSADNLGDAPRSGKALGGGAPADPPMASAGARGRRGADGSSPPRALDDAAPAPSCRLDNSFLPSTRVLMGDGSSKPIQDIEIGDWVLAADPMTGEQGARQVTAVIRGDGDKDLVDITIGGDTITATDGHPFWVVADQAWVDAEDLEPGDRLLLLDGSTVEVDAIRGYTVEAVVYNLTVADLHTYFVVVDGDGVLVHNCSEGTTTQMLSGVTVIHHGQTVAQGTVDLGPTLQRIANRQTGNFPQDGATFFNREGRLPTMSDANYYQEWVVQTPGVAGAGPQRIVVGQGGEMFYTPDHYATFVPLNP